jgi:hypothetical protein
LKGTCVSVCAAAFTAPVVNDVEDDSDDGWIGDVD